MLVDSNERELENQEILLEAAKQIKDNRYSPDQILAALISESREKDTVLIRQGNTLFIVHKGKNRTAFFRALNADVPANYLENSVMFSKAMYMAGFDVMVTEFNDPSLLNIFKYVQKNRNQVNPDKDGKPTMGYAVQKTEKGGRPGYRVTVVLGPKRGGQIK
jgi:hypothetical protein